MTLDLWCLVANALWGFVLVLIEIAGKTSAAGAAWNRGNRDASQSFPAWTDRAGRALTNHKENFPMFLTAVLVVQLAGRADRVSGYASITYMTARLLHAALYIGGVTGVRTAVWWGGVLSTLVIFSRLFV